tara:strand:- start:624 stop:941 length:318 start_codon:yes stop_codon:yes gene_type:complete
MIGGVAAAAAAISSRSNLSGGALGGNQSTQNPRWHQLSHLGEDVESHEFEESSNSSNFSDANHGEINKKRAKAQNMIAFMGRGNFPVSVIQKRVNEIMINQENAG